MPIIRECRARGCREPAVPGRRGRCAMHAASTAERGYGRPHQTARDELARTLPAPCAYGCGTILHRSDSWVAAHVIDGDPTAGVVASCADCNQAARGGTRRPLATAVIVGQVVT